MDGLNEPVLIVLAAGSIAVWLCLLVVRGGFWRDGPYLGSNTPSPDAWPSVVAVVPARNEAETIGASIAGLRAQDYQGPFSIVLVDDQSTDGTTVRARAAPRSAHRVDIVTGTALPAGWTGKLWAVAQGIEYTGRNLPRTEYFWLSDADIVHGPQVLRTLVAKAERDSLGLVSQMVLLRCEGAWERLLVPAFVFFFKKLYPFSWVNDRRHRTSAAAGGCMLVRASALEASGGIESIRGEIIDDCALARAVKRRQPIWLGLTHASRSLRHYDRLADMWDMVARTAFVQLRHSFLLLAGTVLGMAVVYLVPAAAALLGLALGSAPLTGLGLLGWGMMAFAYLPTLRLYGLSKWRSFLLPLAALLYTSMTITSAWRALSGRGPRWKDRHYIGGMGTSLEP